MAKVIITMHNEFLKTVDEKAKAEHRSRSEFVREALRYYIAERRPDIIHERSKRMQEAVTHLDEARRRSMGGKVKGSEIIQQWRYRLER